MGDHLRLFFGACLYVEEVTSGSRVAEFARPCIRFVVFLVRNVAKRCTSMIFGRKVTSVVSVELHEINIEANGG
jgi:hypothetical protein